MLAGVRYIGGKMFSNDTMPVGGVLLVKEALDVLSNLLLSLFLVDGPIDLLLDVLLHFG